MRAADRARADARADAILKKKIKQREHAIAEDPLAERVVFK